MRAVVQTIQCHSISSVASWMNANRLQLNAAKTEFTWCVPPQRRHQLPPDQLTVDPVDTVDRVVLASVDSVRDVGLHLSSNISMDAHIKLVVNSCFGILRQIHCVCRSLPREALAILVTYIIHRI